MPHLPREYQPVHNGFLLEIDSALEQWQDLAAFAYASYLAHGPGAVKLLPAFQFVPLVSVGEAALLDIVRSYDATREVVVMCSGANGHVVLTGSSINIPRIIYERQLQPSVATEDRVAHAFTRYKRLRRKSS